MDIWFLYRKGGLSQGCHLECENHCVGHVFSFHNMYFNLDCLRVDTRL